MRHDRSQLVDAAVLVWVLLVTAVAAVVRGDPSTRPLALTLGITAAAVLVFRRRAPTATFAVSTALVLVLFAVDPTVGAVAAIAPAVALYTLALSRGRLHLVVAVAASAAAVVVADLFLSGHHGPTLTLQTAAHVSLVAIPVLAAEALRNRRAYVQMLEERLERAERDREEEAERRAQQERLRIARDLHDVVAHTLTTINVQAGVASHLDRDPSPAREALATIESESHEALEELRTILGVLRDRDNGQAAPLEPAPDLAALESLIEQARLTGFDVSFDVEGEQPAEVPAPVQLAAFRIVQESLTNARRHAPDATTHVTLAYEPNRLTLAIENDLGQTGNGDGRPGVGILGMRERSTALGGTFEAKPSGDRFRVVAELPYRRSP